LENEKSYVLDYQKDIFDVKRRQDSTDKAASGLLGYESLEDRPVLSYFDKLRRAKNLVSDLREQE
jgi:hypothetical protein